MEIGGNGVSSDNASSSMGYNDVDVDDAVVQYSPNNSTVYWIPNCSAELKPFVGQQFGSLDDAVCFYKSYADSCGFEVRHSTIHKSRDGVVVLKYMLCSRAGYKVGKNNTGKRRRVTNRVGCTAKIILKFIGSGRYVVKTFVDRHTHTFVKKMYRHFMRSNRVVNVAHQNFVMSCAKANMGSVKSYRLYKQLVGGYPNIGALSSDFKNVKRDLLAFIGGADAQMVIDKFFQKKERCSAFYFDYDVDSADQLTCLFWADPVSIKNYSIFGDIVSFDSTYRTNRYNMVFAPFTGLDSHQKCVTFGAGLLLKEDIPSYTWLFDTFLKAMGGKEPRILVTDQDPAMKVAIQTVFNQTRHRFCMWHIMSKASEKIGPSMKKSGDFLTKLNGLVWSHTIEPEVFEESWSALVLEFNMQDHSWFRQIFEFRSNWIPAFFRDVLLSWYSRTTSMSESQNRFFGNYNNRAFSLVELVMLFDGAMDSQRHEQWRLNSESESKKPDLKTPLPLEKHAADVFTLKLFYEVQEEIYAACFSCRFISKDAECDGEVYTIGDPNGMNFKVRFSVADEVSTCTCKLFERIGIPCRHMVLVFKDRCLEQFPSNVVLNRWTKNAILKPSIGVSGVIFDQCAGMVESKFVVNDIWSEVHCCIDLIGDDCAKLKELLCLIKEHRSCLSKCLRRDVSAAESNASSSKCKSSKEKAFESFVGTTVPTSISVLPPQQAKNKGSGRRIKSSREVAISKATKATRKCGVCKKYVDHNSRTCPEK